MFFLVLSHGISTTLLQMLISLRFLTLPFKGVYWCSTKRLFQLSEASANCCFEKIPDSKIFANHPVEHSGVCSFEVHSQVIEEVFQEVALLLLLLLFYYYCYYYYYYYYHYYYYYC